MVLLLNSRVCNLKNYKSTFEHFGYRLNRTQSAESFEETLGKILNNLPKSSQNAE